MIDITNSIPSGISSDLGYSTLVVRVHDLSSAAQDDYTYYVLVRDYIIEAKSLKSILLIILQENGFEFDLVSFTCRRVNVSFAVATNQMALSGYSPSAMLELSTTGTY